jgi:hypothetical protein
MAHDVFISYASQDKTVADTLCATLEARQMRCWIAPRDILPGIPYAEALTEALRSCRILVLVLSTYSNSSKHVMREVEGAVGAGIPVVPFRIADMSLSMSMNYLLKSIHWLDALTPPLGQHAQKLADVIQSLLARSSPAISAAARRTDPSIYLPPTEPILDPTPPARRWWIAPAVLLGLGVPLVLGAWWLLRTVDHPADRTPTAGRTEPPVQSRPAPAPVQLDERARTLPVADVLRVVYEQAPPSPDKETGPLRLQVGLYARRAGENAYRPLTDGEPLASQVDRYWVGIRPLADGYLYVFQVDSQGQADWLFPANPRLASASGSNPVKANAVIQIPPAETSALYLDTHAGMEYLYVVLSAARWPALEDALARPAAPTLAVPPAFADRPLVSATRGVGGTAGDEPPPPFERVSGGGREKLALAAQTYAGNGQFLVVERRFRHVGP